jgi:hypothetical protein
MAENNEKRNERMSPEEREKKRQERLDRKLERAQRDDMGVVSKKTLDSSDFIRLFGTTDYMLNLIRRNMGRKGQIDITKAARYLTEVERIKEELNTLNAEMCRELGADYTPPQGYDNPLKEDIRETEIESMQ